jgi:hypothetical protein
MKYILSFCFSILFLASQMHAQLASVQSDRYQIRLGESFSLTIKAAIQDGQRIVWPVFVDSIGPHFDILKLGKIDTLPDSAKAGSQFLQKIEATSFDSGMHTMPVFAFDIISANGDTAHIVSDPLTFQVSTVPVDTTKAIKDIHGVLDVPFDISEYIPWILVGLLIAALIAAGLYFWLKRKRKPEESKPQAPTIPAWQRALTALDEIAKEKVWQAGRDKVYHSAITDTLRMYLEEQFQLPALESTTDETLEMLRKASFSQDSIQQLKQVLVLADLVKFAKEKPLPIEHERALEYAREFVQITRPKELVNKDQKKGDSGE